MSNGIHNPDVLSCLANLSSDEVFTPPEIANAMLDLLPQELFSDPSATFLDPCCKSGVFLREIAKRLNKGLEAHIPNREDRLEHIFRNQLFGIAITELTSLLARRGVYCSKYPNGPYSVVRFDNADGNIRYKHITPSWRGGKCVFCGASQAAYGEQARQEGLESHAYEFIHTNNPNNLFPMNFDVIIGNPPYQLSDGGDTEERRRGGAIPLYHLFIQQAKKLDPRYLIMIVPSRWFSGGRGLNQFRNEMLNDKRIEQIVDYPDSSECFPGVQIEGGICYFLWTRGHDKNCLVKTIQGTKISSMIRPLLENKVETFIRYNESISILRKVQKHNEPIISKLFSSQKPFGLRTYIKGKDKKEYDSITLYANNHIGYIRKEEILQNNSWIDTYKVFISAAYGMGGKFPTFVIGKPFLGKPGTCCTETYLFIGPFRTKIEAENVISYIRTRFFRFMVLLKKNTQHAAAQVYSLVPMQDFSKAWTDEELYAKYGLTEEEIEFIENMIRPMES